MIERGKGSLAPDVAACVGQLGGACRPGTVGWLLGQSCGIDALTIGSASGDMDGQSLRLHALANIMPWLISIFLRPAPKSPQTARNSEDMKDK